jgi:hypothetical protein
MAEKEEPFFKTTLIDNSLLLGCKIYVLVTGEVTRQWYALPVAC